MHGQPIVVHGSNYLARAIQHETDHLDGILFIDRLAPDLRKGAMKEIRESEWFGSAVANGTTPVIKVSPHATRGLGL
jgi:peptide deformylase